eukprot:TRINITY_DN11357_c0_g1_i1.p1 TRINITY_DN11357_c0_g1~~TRINITY_DN11357_c0_g1_i1.p1  ORF type:complete len:255 (+),score=48.28 TRINITY_DN11357_c0_g1_i1:56-820(+)
MFKTHKLRPGDNMMMLSLRYGVAAGDIMKANNLLYEDLDFLNRKVLDIPCKEAVLQREKAVKALTVEGLAEPEAKYYLDVAEWNMDRAKEMYKADLQWMAEEPPNKGLRIVRVKRCSSNITLTGGIIKHDFLIFECQRYANTHGCVFICAEKVRQGVVIREDVSFDRVFSTTQQGRLRVNPLVTEVICIPVLIPMVTVTRLMNLFLNTPYSVATDNCKHFASSVLKLIEYEIQNEKDRCYILTNGRSNDMMLSS